MSSTSNASGSTQGSRKAYLKAKAVAARFKAEAEERKADMERQLLEIQLKLRITELDIAAKQAEIECAEYEESIRDDRSNVESWLSELPDDHVVQENSELPVDHVIQENSDLPVDHVIHENDRVEHLLPTKPRATMNMVERAQPTTQAVELSPNIQTPDSFLKFLDDYPTPSHVHTRGGTTIPPPVLPLCSPEHVVERKVTYRDIDHSVHQREMDHSYDPRRTDHDANLRRMDHDVSPRRMDFESQSNEHSQTFGHNELSNVRTPRFSTMTALEHPVSSPMFESFLENCQKTNVQVAEALARAQLPRIDPEKFSGDPCSYVSWKRSALTQLSLAMSSTERLIRLEKMVEKEPASIVKQYSERFPSQASLAYDKAWEVLDYRFGRSSVIAEALLAKLNGFKRVTESDYTSLRSFSDLCTAISLQVDSLPGLKVLDYPMYLRPIAGRLPLPFQRRWTDQAHRILKNAKKENPLSMQEYPTFSEFATFLDDLSDKLCDPNLRPMYENVKSGKRASVGKRFGADGGNKDFEDLGAQPNSCLVHPRGIHTLSKCKLFRRLPTEKQIELLKSNSEFCRTCLEVGHGSNCSANITCSKCPRKHYTFLHDASGKLGPSDRTPHSYSIKSQDFNFNRPAICPAQRIYVSDGNGLATLTVLHDTGSQSTLVTLETCERLGFERISDEMYEVDIEVLGGDRISTSGHKYVIPIYDGNSNLITSISAHAIEKIGSDLPRVDLTKASRIFGVDTEIEYPTGQIHILLGMDNGHATITTIAKVDSMILAESLMGKMIYGAHSSFSTSASTSGFRVLVKPSDLRMDLVPSLFSTDVLGISCTPKCGGCACKQCPPDDAPYTLQERHEYDQIKSTMTLEDGIVTASYPYVRDPSLLEDNYSLAMRRLCQTERSLARDPVRASKYQDQIDDMINRGILRKLSPEEEAAWTGPVQYLPHNDVLKPGSESTPTRLVFDPSAQYKGKAVNQFWGRGPCLMNDPIGILLRFREHPTAFAGDISKMYWCIHTRPQEWHLHRVLWRNMDTNRLPDKYLIVRNSFGSGPAGTVAIAALNFLAERRVEDLPEGAYTIQHQAFVDDVIDSCPTREDAERITGEIDSILADGSFKIKKWLIVNSSSETPGRETNLTQNESVLGIAWNTTDDEFYFVPRLNFHKKRKKIRQGPDLTPGQVFDRSIVPSLTKRAIISQVNSLYDPLGLLSPFLVELKFGVAKLWRLRETLDWDAVIPDDHDERWRQLFEMFFEISKLRFPRILRPTDAVEPPKLIAFADSSMVSYCSVLYVRWTLTDRSVFARLIMAKTRMWPIEPEDYISVARGELLGLQLAKRLVATVLKESRFKFDEILYITDSEIVLAQINMNSHEFGVWTGSRVAEIRQGTELSQFWFVRSADNPCADLCSRGTTDFNLLGNDSTWQRGPSWIYKPRSEWPVIQNVKTTKPIPDMRAESLARRTLVTSLPPDPTTSGDVLKPLALPVVQKIPCQVFKAIQTLGEFEHSSSLDSRILPRPRLEIAEFASLQEDFIASRFDLTRHDNWSLWLATTVRVLHALSWKPGSSISFLERLVEPANADDRVIAERFWLRQAQRQLLPDIKKGKYASLTPFLDLHGIWRINGRSQSTSKYLPILLPSHHPVSRLIVIAIHRRCHDGRGSTASRTRAEYHIIKVRRLASQIRANCQTCILKEKRLLQVPMAPLPVARLEPTYAFEHTSCDLFGPFQVKLEGRVTRGKSFDPEKLKAYGLLFACLSTRAVHVEVMQGQDTDAFLLAFRRFISIRGQPRTLYSDNGTQLVAADQELRRIVAEWDSETLRKFGAENGIIWTYTSPGSPWANGITEALVKSVKRSLKYSMPVSTLTILELSTIFAEVSELLNERPIGIGSRSFTGDDFDGETNSYLCPNQMLLGRSTVRIPSGPFQTVPVSNANRFLANQTVVTEWWQHWYSEYLPSLVNQTKWFRSDRHSKVGDIVQVRDLNPVRGNWNIAEIIDVKPSADNIPRNVLLRYKNVHPGKSYQSVPYRTQWRDVKNLSLLLPVEKRVSSLDPTAESFVPKRR